MWIFLVCLAIFLFGIRKYRALFRNYENVDTMYPGPQTLPILGNALTLYGDAHDLYKTQKLYAEWYRRSFRIWLGPCLFILLQQPSEVEALVNNMTYHKKGLSYETLVPWIGRGLIISNGHKWKRTRKTLTPAFHFNILESFLELFNDNCTVFCEKLKTRVGLPGFNVYSDIKLFALDNICETAMGTKIEAQKYPESEYVTSVHTMCHIAFLKTMRPWLQIDLIFKLTREGFVYAKALSILHGFTQKVIKKRIEERKQSKSETLQETDDIGIRRKKVFLDILLDAYDEGIMNLSEVQEEVDTFMFAGHDTITSALSFTFYCLAENPECQEKAFAEQFDIFGDEVRAPTLDDLNKMKYLELVIKEVLRIYPSDPMFVRSVEQSLQLDKGVVIPAGSQAVVSVLALHFQPESWERPNEFYPEHFLPDATAKRHPYSYIPFSAGPRNCIGMKFAMLEMKITLSNVIRKFKLMPGSPKVPLKPGIEVVLQPLTGVMVSVVERSTASD